MKVMSLWTRPNFENLRPAEAELFIPVLSFAEVVAGFILGSEAAFVPAVFDITEEFDTELVRIEAIGAGGHGAAVVVGVVDHFGVEEAVTSHDGGVPIAGPAFVHDFGLSLGGEVVSFLADDGEDVVLPGVERGVFEGGRGGHRVGDVRGGASFLSRSFSR